MAKRKMKNAGGRSGTWKKKASSQLVTKSDVYSMINQRTSGLLGIEKKFLRSHFINTSTALGEATNDAPKTFHYTGFSGGTNLFACRLGDSATDREGSQITVDSLTVKGRLMIEAIGTSAITSIAACRWKILLVLDKQVNGTAPVLSDILDSAKEKTGGVLDGWNLLAYPKIENQARFRVLAQKTIIHNPVAPTLGSTGIYHQPSAMYDFSFHKKWANGLKVNYVTNGNDDAAVADNGVFFFAVQEDEDLLFAHPVAYLRAATSLRFRG